MITHLRMMKMTLIEALTEEQITIMLKGKNDDYPFEQSIKDIDLIADLTELKIKLRKGLI